MHDLFEASFSWSVDDDLEDNEREMLSKFHGYNREMKHFSTKEKRLLRDPSHIERVRNVLSKSPVGLSFYFWQSNDADYDQTSFHGEVSADWLKTRLGEKSATAIVAATRPDAITLVFTNNLSDQAKIGLDSPWIIAHRVAHGLFDSPKSDLSWRVHTIFDRFLHHVLEVGYGCKWPDKEAYGGTFYDDYKTAYGQLMGHTLGTMKSARKGNLVSVYEWWYETFAQFLVTGSITLRPLPEHFDEGLDLTTDPKRRGIAQRDWARLPGILEKTFVALMHESCGKVFNI